MLVRFTIFSFEFTEYEMQTYSLNLDCFESKRKLDHVFN